MEQEFNGKVVWVVGASGALGAEIARHLHLAGAIVVVSGRSREKIDVLAAAAPTAGAQGRIDAMPVDVTQSSEVTTVADAIVSRHGRIDGLVNTVSLSLFGDFVELDDDVWSQVLNTKLMGYVRTCRAVIPHMIAQGGGNIVNISGRSARQPLPAHLPGGCANAAVNLLTKGLADHYYPHNIRANVVSPGPIKSDRFDQIQTSNDRVQTQPDARPVLTRRIGQPDDIALAVRWLLSSQSRHLTGTVMPVDGGSTACV